MMNWYLLIFSLFSCVWSRCTGMDMHGGVKMGVVNHTCDDTKTNLTVDWDYLKDDEYVCKDANFMTGRSGSTGRHHVVCEEIKPPLHKCLPEPILYSERIPASGSHRPLWPVYGEYKFLPPQRWLHSLEHGAIVMLYHPCADSRDVSYLRSLVNSCLYRHVITPYRKLTSEKPLALVSYGCRLELSHFDFEAAVSFITTHALHGGEKTSKDGQYTFELIEKAQFVCGRDDRNLCLADPSINDC